MRKAMIYLQKYGISLALSAKIYEHYGQSVYRVMEENPYQIADHVQGVGFKTADEIASKVGIHTDSDFRIRSGSFLCAAAECDRRTCLSSTGRAAQANDAAFGSRDL